MRAQRLSILTSAAQKRLSTSCNNNAPLFSTAYRLSHHHYHQPQGNNSNNNTPYANYPPPPPPPPYAYTYAYNAPPPPPPPPPQPPVGSSDRPLYVSVVSQQARFSFIRSIGQFFLFYFVVFGTIVFISKSVSFMINVDEATNNPDAKKSGSGSVFPPRGGGVPGLGSLFSNNELPKPVTLDKQQVTFSDVRGCDEAKEELEEIVLFLKDPSKFKELGGKLPKGALLVGPPGCGKTMLAKAIAKEAGVSFFYCSGSEFDEMFVGVGARRIRDLFASAKKHGPSLVFIDEIDALGASRNSRDMSYTRMTLNQLLSEMDGFNSADDVIVIGATNTPDTLDKALTRPGRFDRHINVDPPDVKGRRQILELYLQKVKMSMQLKLEEVAETVARGTTGFTGAELQNLINLAAIRAVMVGHTGVDNDDLEYARDRVMMGAENHSKKISDKEKKDTAYHEGGHALVAMHMEKMGADPVHKATIIPRGSGVLGLVQQLPESDTYSMCRQQMIARLAVCLAGRAAEDVILGPDHVTSGAMSDFQQATRLARNMIRRYGFNSGLGYIDYESADTNSGAMISEKTKQVIEQETKELVMTSYEMAKEVLTTNRAQLDRVAKGLLEFETLSGAELKRLTRDPTEDLEAVFEEMRKGGKVKSSEMAERARKMRKETSEAVSSASSGSGSGGGNVKVTSDDGEKKRGISIPIITSKKD
eukprot:PhM_4_TR7580/c1_g1_i1/m.68703/K08955/YME1; ATP-dependent metalloprotease